MNLLDKLIRRLQLESIDQDVYRGGAGSGGVTENDRLFGGLVAAQAAVAAANSVHDFPIHSLHAYFLRPGRPDADIRFEVSRSKQGRNFQVRHVTAIQADELIFQLQASFQRGEAGVMHQTECPQTDSPTHYPNRDQLRGRDNWQEMPIDVRMVSPISNDQAEPAEQSIWLKVNGEFADLPALHLGLLVYASDRTLLSTAWRPHANLGAMSGASLDHSMWFHQPPRFDDWLLYHMHSPAAANGRGLAFGAMYNQDGQRVVSLAQEGVMRLVRP